MSRWSDLFSALSRGVTDGDTSRHTGEHTKGSDPINLSVCHGVSPSVKGVDTEKRPTKKSNGKVETTSSLPLGTRFTKALTDGDASRHIEGTSSGTLSDLSRCVTVCQSPLFLDLETKNTGGCKLDTSTPSGWQTAGPRSSAGLPAPHGGSSASAEKPASEEYN